MKKQIIPINLINLVVIISIMSVVGLLSQNIIKELTLKDIQNVTRLTKTNIHAEIKQELIEPLNTSLIMAQNIFAFDFMNDDTVETEEKFSKYLSKIQDYTGYDSVFWVPHGSLSYYHPGGTDSKVDLDNDSSYWYKERIDAKDDYSIVVNPEQLDNFELTAFIDAIIRGEDGEFLGVTGIGTRLEHLQEILSSQIRDHGVEAYLINDEGLIQVHHNTSIVREMTFYELEDIPFKTMDFQKNERKPLENQVGDKFVIVQYIPMLDWYLVVSKSTSALTQSLNEYSVRIYVAFGIAVIIMMTATTLTIDRYKKQIISLSNIDQLTAISNRTIFDSALEDAMSSKKHPFCLALFDLDNLKNINDKYGHERGDYALKTVASIAINHIKNPNIVSRVGGDEFGIIVYQPLDESKNILNNFFAEIQNNIELKAIEATLSIGFTKSMDSDTESTIYKRADEALYLSKNAGKNKVTSK